MKENTLTDLFDCEEDKIIEQDENVLIIDGHNIAYRNAYSTIYQCPEDNGEFELWRHQMIQSFFYFIKKFKPTTIIFAFDEKGSWRYSVYPEYKANRAANRNKGKMILDHENFIKALEQFIKDMKEIFNNIYVLKLKRAEADDIIAIMSREVFKDKNITIISGDGDMHQLITKNVQQYDPRQNKIIECINPQKELTLKILKGDSSDNIKPIKKGVGIKTAEKIMNMGFDKYIDGLNEDDKKIVLTKYEQNKTLINFDFIPEDLKEKIINIYATYKTQPFDGKKVVRYFMKHKLLKHMSEWNIMSDFIKDLK